MGRGRALIHLSRADAEAHLEYVDGRLVRIDFPDGGTSEYTYGALGLRESVRVHEAGTVRYRYDVNGGLRDVLVEEADGDSFHQTVKLDSHGRIAEVLYGEAAPLRVRYGDGGNVSSFETGERRSAFLYDEYQRLVSVRPPAGGSLQYQYAANESGLRVQGDQRTGVLVLPGSEAWLNYDRLSQIDSRVELSPYDVVGFDSQQLAFHVLDGPERTTTEWFVLHTLDRSELLDLFDPSTAASARARFDQPSTSAFLPAEYRSINCCIPCDRNDPAMGALCGQCFSWGGVEPGLLCFCMPSLPPPPPPPGPGPGTVELVYTMFIPLDHVRLPALFGPAAGFNNLFSGDNTGSYIDGALFPDGLPRFRIQQRLLIDTVGGTVRWVNLSGTTKQFDQVTDLTTNKSCFRKDCNCPQYVTPIFFGWFTWYVREDIIYKGMCIADRNDPVATATADNVNTMIASVATFGPGQMKVVFSGAPSNSLVVGASVAGPITWQHTLTLTWNANSASWRLDLRHDGFPFHHIKIGNQIVYTFDPVTRGQTPMSLGFPLDQSAARTGSR